MTSTRPSDWNAAASANGEVTTDAKTSMIANNMPKDSLARK